MCMYVSMYVCMYVCMFVSMSMCLCVCVMCLLMLVCSGHGKMLYGSGDIYEGQWRDGKPNGNGLYLHADGVLIREGEFRDGLLHGQGKVLGCNGRGTIYQGTFQKVVTHACFHRYEYYAMRTVSSCVTLCFTISCNAMLPTVLYTHDVMSY
jgi:hypothetical protein